MHVRGLVLAIAFGLAGCSGPSAATDAFDGGLAEPLPATVAPGSSQSVHTRYPIILVHGFSGYKNIGPLNYFLGVSDALTAIGAQVFTAQLDTYNTSEARGAELATYIGQVLSDSKAAKVNLICHSQGGLDCRWAASDSGGKLGDKISAVVTIGTSHRGTPVADVAVGDIAGPLQDALAFTLNLFGNAVSSDSNVRAATEQLTTKGAALFNQNYPDSASVRYFSIAGRSDGARGDVDCATATEASFIGRYDQITDPLNLLYSVPTAICNDSANPPPANDGMVTVASARWGTFLGCLPTPHLGEVCQFFGANPSYDCHQTYRDLANWLVSRGF